MTEYSPKQIDMISKACRIAGVNYPDFDVTKEWVLGLAEVAKEATDENKHSYRDYDTDHEMADTEVPYMTYRLWLIWTDLQLYQEYDFDYFHSNYGDGFLHKQDLEYIPQLACYEIALKVIQGWK